MSTFLKFEKLAYNLRKLKTTLRYCYEMSTFPRWCDQRDLNSQAIGIRPSNVRVYQFRHDRMKALL